MIRPEGRPDRAAARQPRADGRRQRSGGDRRSLPGPPPNPAQLIGSFFRSTRQSQDLSQEQVAALTRGLPGGVSRAMISAIERGIHMPGVEVLLTLSQALHVSPGEVLERLELCRGEPVDIAGMSLDEADRAASQCYWAGEYRRAAAHYDAMLRRLNDAPIPDETEQRRRLATLEFRRGAALRRCGATNAARAAVERAITMTDDLPELQAQAYIVLVALLVQTGCLPLARDAADRAVALAEGCDDRVRGWAWIERGEVHAACGRFAEARAAFLEARRHVLAAGDRNHEIHVEGNIGACLHGLGRLPQARARYTRAVALARRYEVPAAEALWLVELGRLALAERRLEAAEGYARAALRIAKPADQLLTTFRAEWLLHEVSLVNDPEDPDRHRVAYLRKLYTRLEEHRGIEEVREFKRRYASASNGRRL